MRSKYETNIDHKDEITEEIFIDAASVLEISNKERFDKKGFCEAK